MKTLFAATIIVLVWLHNGSMYADEVLPSPQPIGPYPPTTIRYAPAPTMVYTRKSAYDVWNNYGITPYGRFRARVIVAPNGAYYRYDGSPYYWSRVRPQSWSSGPRY